MDKDIVQAMADLVQQAINKHIAEKLHHRKGIHYILLAFEEIVETCGYLCYIKWNKGFVQSIRIENKGE